MSEPYAVEAVRVLASLEAFLGRTRELVDLRAERAATKGGASSRTSTGSGYSSSSAGSPSCATSSTRGTPPRRRSPWTRPSRPPVRCSPGRSDRPPSGRSSTSPSRRPECECGPIRDLPTRGRPNSMSYQDLIAKSEDIAARRAIRPSTMSSANASDGPMTSDSSMGGTNALASSSSRSRRSRLGTPAHVEAPRRCWRDGVRMFDSTRILSAMGERVVTTDEVNECLARSRARGGATPTISQASPPRSPTRRTRPRSRRMTSRPWRNRRRPLPSAHPRPPDVPHSRRLMRHRRRETWRCPAERFGFLDADAVATDARAAEDEARDRYHEAETEAQQKQRGG